jgi:stage II sporulation protein D
MKKIIIFTAFLVFIPFLIVYLFNITEKQELIELNTITTTKVRVKRQKTDTIDTIPLEEYVSGVLAGEMPISFDIEALKAQAVASRTYVLKRIQSSQNNDYDVVDSVTNQVYLDNDELKEKWGKEYNTKMNKIREAVNQTTGEYLEYNGEIIDALFFSTSNGYTEDSGKVFNLDLPYLKSVTSEWDSKISSVFNSTANMSLQEFYEKLDLTYDNNLVIDNIERSSSNRVTSLSINGTTFKGTDIYNKLSLKSTDFTITQIGSNVEIKTIGYGHGVGMSQYGAEGMSQEGYNYKEILNHYYTDTTIKTLEN